MKILMCIFDIENLGGIINHAEHLTHGLNALGHEVYLYKIVDKEVIRRGGASLKGTATGPLGIPFDQLRGWVFPQDRIVPFKSINWKRFTKKFDLVLWEVPYPPISKFKSDPKKLYSTSVPQIPFIHDGNMVKMYPELSKFKNRFEFFACVHDCAMGNTKHMGLEDRSRLIVNPQVIGNRMVKPNFKRRRRVCCSFQTFKRWKRVDDLVRSVPRIDGKVIVGGGGIEYYYMTSKTKRRPQYGRIWEEAIDAGMKYLGYISEDERDLVMEKSRLLIDTSWSRGYNKYGSHFNRIMVDAAIKGCLPVLRDLAMDDNSVFPYWLYESIPFDCDSEYFANKVNSILSMDGAKANKMVSGIQNIIKTKFDSVVVAKELMKGV